MERPPLEEPVGPTATTREATAPSGEEVSRRELEVFVQPRAQRIAAWKDYARGEAGLELQLEALQQLAWSREPSGVTLAISALAGPNERLRARAARSLAEYGPPLALPARDALYRGLHDAEESARLPLLQALIALEDNRAFDALVDYLRTSPGAGLAVCEKFETARLARLVPAERWMALGTETNTPLRALAACVLAEDRDPRSTQVLLALSSDPESEVALAAIGGLAMRSDDRARAAVRDCVRTAQGLEQRRVLESIRNRAGAAALIAVLDVAPKDPPSSWDYARLIFELIHDPETSGSGLNDPRGASALVQFMGKRPHAHLEWRAAVALAAIGDSRAVPSLARRLRFAPFNIYDDQTRPWEAPLILNDDERVIAARMIADLATLYPDQRALIVSQAEGGVRSWLNELPAPHANGLRALASMGGVGALPWLRRLANPSIPLPAVGRPAPMDEEFWIAGTALRYLGMLKDGKSRQTLNEALTKRAKERAELNLSMEALTQNRAAILGFSLTSLARGAADGFSEWNDRAALQPLVTYAEDAKNNEVSRFAACSAIAWLIGPGDVLDLAQHFGLRAARSSGDRVLQICFLTGLADRPQPTAATALLSVLDAESFRETRPESIDSEARPRHFSRDVRLWAAIAIGKGGYDDAVAAKLLAILESGHSGAEYATLALMLGASPDMAARSVALYARDRNGATDLARLSKIWLASFQFWSAEDVSSGRLLRFVENAEAIARLSVLGHRRDFARKGLAESLDAISLENGPHSLTRVTFRNQLWKMAQATRDERELKLIFWVLASAREQGVLLALRDEPDPVGAFARSAYFRFMHRHDD